MMKKFKRFLGRISAETCLKMEYFGSQSPKSPVQVKCLENVQDPTPIEITG